MATILQAPPAAVTANSSNEKSLSASNAYPSTPFSVTPRTSADGRTLVHTDSEDPEAQYDQVVPPGEERDDPTDNKGEYLVKWDGPDDPENPKNWTRGKRWYLTSLAGLLVLNATFASSAPAGVIRPLIEEFHMSSIVATLTISLFVAGYCVGPLLWGPLSEQYGRKPVLVVGFFAYTCFQIGSALAPNTAAVLIFRFIGGTFAAAPLTTSGGIIADIWDADTRGKALAVFTLAPFAGPSIGPIVGGYIYVGGASWRWLFWVLTIFAGLCTILIQFTLPETYAPIIMAGKAERRRKETGDEKYFAEIERENLHWRKRVSKVLLRPFKILFVEPMLIAVTLYMSFVYGCVYLLFEAYPIVFTEGHHLNSGQSGLMFLPVFAGGVIAVIAYLLVFNPRYERLMEQFKPKMVPPEYRLEPAYWAAPSFVIAFLWFGWTSYPSISLYAPLFSGVLMGFSVILLFLPLFNYIIDAYLMVAASALASSTVVRSAFGAGFPLFATQMYVKLNPRWASTVLAGIAFVLLPIPFVLARYGPAIRRSSKYAPSI